MIFRIINQYQYYLFFSKLLERLMFNRLKHFLSNNGIISEAQNSCRKGSSIERAIQSFIDRI